MRDHERFRRLQDDAAATGLEIGHVRGSTYSVNVKHDPLIDGTYLLDEVEELVLTRRLAILKAERAFLDEIKSA